ncbi:MAG: rod shape-determining protein MreD [Clostridia bacterium]|nr:rod shape-determining protein MreD [Clostridia bacterium]
MRHVVLALICFLAVVLAGSCAPLLEIAGIPVDLPLLILVPLAMLERTGSPVILAAASGFLLDLMYSTVMGMSMLCYTLAAALIFFLCRRADRLNFFMVFGAGIGAYLLKDLVMAGIVTALGVHDFQLVQMMARFILPGALIEGVLGLLTYWLFTKLMRCRFMRRRRIYADELG